MTAMRALVLTGGIAHPFEETAPALAAILASEGIEADVTDDVEAGLARLADRELLVVQCLRWSMVQHEKYAPHRDRWALSLSDAGKGAIAAHLARGRGILGIHAAPISFDAFEAWGELLGARWVWGRSGHPPIGTIRARAVGEADAITRGIGPFALVDELYGDLELAPDARVLVEATADGEAWQPVLVVADRPGRRAAYVAFGHDMRAFAVPEVRTLIGRAARFAAGLDLHSREKGTA